MENLCDRPLFTGYTRDGGYATHTIADARYAFPLGEDGDDVSIAPLLCAGLIGWRSLVMAGKAERLGIYGFGAAGHIVAQVARWQGRSVYAFTRSGDAAAQALARRLGAVWTGARRINCPILRWMPQSSMRPPENWCRRHCARFARAARWYAREST
jgi:propanol-preferring alcohol dehydrogenase